MKKKELNPKQRIFCILRASGVGQFEAYKKAGYKGESNTASELEAKPSITAEIRALQSKTEEKVFDLVKECRKLAPAQIERLEILAASSDNDGFRLNAIQQLLDRGYGKPKQSQEISGPEGQPIPAEIKITFVEPKPNNDKTAE